MPPARLKAPSKVCHAQARALERYGIMLEYSDLGRILGIIQSNHATLVERHPHGTSTWALRYKKIDMRVVVNRHINEICTFLAPVYQRQAPKKRVKTWKNKVAKWQDSYGRQT